MTEETFDKLVDLLDIPVNEAKSQNRTRAIDPIIKPMVVGIGLHFLGGESHKSLEDAFHISKSSSKRAVRRFATAVVQCEALRIKLPKEEELEELMTKWSKMSTASGKPLHGCVLALDGFLSARVTPNVEDDAHYHSNHKKINCLNVQAAIDYLLRFRYVCVAAPGRTNDGRAFDRCDTLRDWIQDLANDCYIASYNAYPLSNKILVPFKANQIGGDQHKVVYNFYLSQLRIRVEMAFGRMTQKFQILRRKMTCSLATQSLYIQAITWLHNFIIDNDSLPEPYGQPANINGNGEFDAAELEALGIQPLPDNLGAGGFTAVAYNANGGPSRQREEIVARLAADDIQRPQP
jgi:hypothetical protein